MLNIIGTAEKSRTLAANPSPYQRTRSDATEQALRRRCECRAWPILSLWMSAASIWNVWHIAILYCQYIGRYGIESFAIHHICKYHCVTCLKWLDVRGELNLQTRIRKTIQAIAIPLQTQKTLQSLTILIYHNLWYIIMPNDHNNLFSERSKVICFTPYPEIHHFENALKFRIGFTRVLKIMNLHMFRTIHWIS